MSEVIDDRHFIAKKIASWFVDGHVINLGVGIPVLVGDYINDGVVIHAENGVLGTGNVIGGLEKNVPYYDASGLTVDLIPGASVFDICTSFAMIRRGKLRATILGCFEVSQYGDLASISRPGSYPGMGGAMDLVSNIDNVIIATMHCAKDGSPKIIEKCTLPLTGVGVVKTIVTEIAVFTVSKTEGLTLVEHREGITVDEIRKKTGAPFVVADDLSVM